MTPLGRQEYEVHRSSKSHGLIRRTVPRLPATPSGAGTDSGSDGELSGLPDGPAGQSNEELYFLFRSGGPFARSALPARRPRTLLQVGPDNRQRLAGSGRFPSKCDNCRGPMRPRRRLLLAALLQCMLPIAQTPTTRWATATLCRQP